MNSVILINDFGIEINLIDQILIKSKLPKSRIIVILSDGYLPDQMLGCCIPRSLVEHQNYIGIFNPHLDKNWDHGVALSVTACEYNKEYPAYFSYLLAHELGHTHQCINDVTIHIHYCLIQEYIKEASSGLISSWLELPHEQLFDKFGIHVAEQMYSHKIMRDELNSIIDNKLSEDLPRIKCMLSLDPFISFDGLREELIGFSLPYKKELISLWRKGLSNKEKTPYILTLVKNFEHLFQ